MTPARKLHQSLLSFITNSLIIKEVVKNMVDIREAISTTKDQPVTLAIEISLTVDSCPIGVSADLCSAGAP